MPTKEIKKRELVCPHTDCSYYSTEQVLVEGEWVLVSYCSNPNSDLIVQGTSCRLYHLNWQKQIKKNGNGFPNGANGVELIRRRRMALLKMLRWTVNQLDAEDREVIFELVNELKQQEEDSFKRKKQSEGTQPTEVNQSSLQPPFDEYLVPTPAEEESYSNGNLTEFSLVEGTRTVQPAGENIQPAQASIEKDVIPAKAGNSKPKIDPNAPEAIVEKFIDCWNTQDFETEYDLLSKRLQVVPKDEYILSRQHAFADALKNQHNGNVPKQKLAEIIATKIESDFAYVECIKSEPAGRFEKEEQQAYSLIRENGQWKISKVRTSPIPKANRSKQRLHRLKNEDYND
ncbi:MAG: hypothetical protein QME64_01205 [bacterium]|nr:hypothetical protein [bacterium]